MPRGEWALTTCEDTLEWGLSWGCPHVTNGSHTLGRSTSGLNGWWVEVLLC